METFRLEGVWDKRLESLNWGSTPTKVFTFCLAESTRSNYNTQIGKLRYYCQVRQIQFPPQPHESAIFADFLCAVGATSDRPESILRSVSAALNTLYQGLGLVNPMATVELKMLQTALVKSGTTRPAKHSKVMPCVAFQDLFRSWPDNDQLALENLRLKAVTLFALVFMARPSDMAPKGVTVDYETGVARHINFTTDQIVFNDDGSLTVTFFGIKNDSTRTGFEVRIPPSAEMTLDPVRCLKDYLRVTTASRVKGGPVFLALKRPYKGLSSGTIGEILKKAISLAGLENQGFTPRSFRPTGATAAVNSGCPPETAMQLGRWKTKEVFFNRYVYPNAPQEYTTNVLQYSGIELH